MGSYKKKLFIVLLLTLLIGCFVCSSANATMQDIQYSVDQPTLLKEQQEYLASLFLKKFDTLATDTQKNDFKDSYATGDYWYFFTAIYVQNQAPKIIMYRIRTSVNFAYLDTYTLNTDDSYFEDTYFTYPVSGYSVSNSELGSNVRAYTYNLTQNTIIVAKSTATIFIPSSVILYDNNALKNYYNGIKPTESSIAMIINAIQENTEEQEEQTEEMKKLNNFMSSEDVDEDAYDMPNENPTQDITESGINGIFTMFYDKINNWESENIVIRIPFANKIFIIPSDLTENIVNSYLPNTTTFGRLFGLIWYYLLGVYIVKDIQKYIDGLQTGEILTKSDTNIKTEML